AAIGFGDGAWWLKGRLGRFEVPARRLAYAGIGLALLRFCLFSPVMAWRYYEERPSLGVPGATRLHLDDDEGGGLRRVVETARRSCTVLMTAPGMPTFNLWTGLPGPTALAGGNWVTGLNDGAQETVARELAGQPNLCVVYSKDMIAMWTHRADVS